MFIWTIWDALQVVFIGAFVIVFMLIWMRRAIQQARCPHSAVSETSACDAICIKCGANLGFIGTWRERTARK